MEINYYNKHIMLTNTRIALIQYLPFFIHSVIRSLIHSANIYYYHAADTCFSLGTELIKQTKIPAALDFIF